MKLRSFKLLLFAVMPENKNKLKHILIGCGNSTLSEKLYKFGCTNITNIDYSDHVIRNMIEKYRDCKEMKWMTMDILHMDFDPNTFDIVSDSP